MRKDILDIHITPHGPSRFIIRVAVESDPGKFIAFVGIMPSLSEYAIDHVAKTGRELSQSHAEIYFADQFRTLTYVEDLPARIEVTEQTTSLAALFEKANSQVEAMSTTPTAENISELNNTLKEIHTLAAPAMVRRTAEGV